jgi:D-alanyl-D-alanine carboxypeptidase/D-alanyl-D-alanine-endopeptidase (penicillin-binding protein 4)
MFCRSIWFLLLITSIPARALEARQYWSNEFVPSEVQTKESLIPFTWGIQWQGASPRFENQDRLFSLASVKKVITAATAMRELGPEFKFTNEFRGEHDETQAAVYNPVFAVTGDPTWGHEAYGETLRTRVAKVVDELKRLKVKKVVGEINIELLKPALANFARPANWKSSWQTACYAGLLTPVILSGNCSQLAIYPNRKAVWVTEGVTTPIVNLMVSSTEDTLSVKPELDSLGRVTRYVLRGGMTRAASIFLPVHSGESWLKRLFVNELTNAGIAYYAKASRWVRHGMLTSFSVDLSSKNLKEILIPFLQNSINIVGERLYLEAPTDLITLSAVVGETVDSNSAVMVDGSGLMAANRITPAILYRFLSGLMQQPYFQDLYAGLPVSGVSGTLMNRMGTDLLKGNVHAKTGTIDLVTNLAGYWTKPDQSLEPFVIFTESSLTATDARKRVDVIVDEFARKN